MTRNLRALGLALMALFAMSAMAASTASAQTTDGHFTTTGPTVVTGVETGASANRLTAFGAFVECKESIYTGHEYNVTPHVGIPNGATTATLTPHYKQTTAGGAPNCVGSLNTSATVHTNGCDYVIHLGETTGGVAGTYGVTFDVVCPTGQEITVTIWLSESAHTNEPNNPKCILHVPPQTGLAGAHATDTGGGVVDLSGTVTGITVSQTRNSILCPAGTHTTTGEFHLDVSTTGKSEGGAATSISITH